MNKYYLIVFLGLIGCNQLNQDVTEQDFDTAINPYISALFPECEYSILYNKSEIVLNLSTPYDTLDKWVALEYLNLAMLDIFITYDEKALNPNLNTLFVLQYNGGINSFEYKHRYSDLVRIENNTYIAQDIIEQIALNPTASVDTSLFTFLYCDDGDRITLMDDDIKWDGYSMGDYFATGIRELTFEYCDDKEIKQLAYSYNDRNSENPIMVLFDDDDKVSNILNLNY